MKKLGNEKQSVSVHKNSSDEKLGANSKQRIEAIGYGLNNCQQEAIADLWTWQKTSLKSNILIGGPIC